MTTFVHCRGCGQQIHETAPTCPKCGAPQVFAAAAPAGVPSAPAVSAYSAVPWYRRRWFIVLCILTISPIAGLVALTGPLYYAYKAQPRRFPKGIKTGIYIASIWWLVQLALGPGSTSSLLYMVTVVVMGLILGFRRQWPDK